MFLNKKQNLKLGAAFVILLYITIPVLLLQHMVSMAGMNGFSNECTHITSGNSICPMDVAGHYSVWQQLSLSVPQYIYILYAPVLLLFAFGVLFGVKFLIHQIQYIKKQRHRPIRVFIEELFAKGILNTKVFYI